MTGQRDGMKRWQRHHRLAELRRQSVATIALYYSIIASTVR
jgi:hypothetical protein